MAKLQIIYDASTEIERIVKQVEEHVDMKRDESEIYTSIQQILQKAFNDGRNFQKQITLQSDVRDSLIFDSKA